MAWQVRGQGQVQARVRTGAGGKVHGRRRQAGSLRKSFNEKVAEGAGGWGTDDRRIRVAGSWRSYNCLATGRQGVTYQFFWGHPLFDQLTHHLQRVTDKI